MWRLKSISAKNLMSFANMEYELNQGVTTLVFGENVDNDSQKSNGSGKSALLECISVGITGAPMRRVKNEEIINDASETCEVSLEFINAQLNERMVIDRQFFRKSSSVCNVDLYRSGKLVTTDEAKQSSVDEYNKYILFKLGISKDELYNNFLLSKHKYQDFLSSSDKDKKDIINRFSNGNRVDEAIDKVKLDIEPIEEECRQASLKISNIEGKIEVVSEQIASERDRVINRQSTLQSRIDDIDARITERRSDIRKYNIALDENEDAYNALILCEGELGVIETKQDSIQDAYNSIAAALAKQNIKGLSNWVDKADYANKQILQLNEKNTSLNKDLESLEALKHDVEVELASVSSRESAFTIDFIDRKTRLDTRIKNIQEELEDIDNEIVELNKQKRAISLSIAELQSKLSGTIVCPKCSHEFILTEDGFDVCEAKNNVLKLIDQSDNMMVTIVDKRDRADAADKNKSDLAKEKQALINEKAAIDQEINSIKAKSREIGFSIQSIKNNINTVTNQLTTSHEAIDRLYDNMVKEAFQLLDQAFDDNERSKNKIESGIAEANGNIEALQLSIESIKSSAAEDATKSLEKTLTSLKAELEEMTIARRQIERQMKGLNVQIERFNEFKTYLANTKVEAMSVITNEFLEHIGSDIRIKFSGYTMLKSGKIRDKISISLLRDGLDCGSYGKFSEGEKARANLASILAMQKLVNSNCELGKGLDLIVLDEILESVDEDGLANMFKVLNKLEITTLVVSHGLVSENYPYKLIVIKENGESVLKTCITTNTP